MNKISVACFFLLGACLQVGATSTVAADQGATQKVAATVMPAPQITQFSARIGGAPVASGKGVDVGNLPLVSDKSQSTPSLSAKTTVIEQDSPHQLTAPVVDVSGVLPASELAVLKKQVQNLIDQGDLEKITALQEQLEKINGLLAEEKNSLLTLQKKQDQFYQDLDQRISVIEQKTQGSIELVSAKPNQVASASLASAGKVGQDKKTYQAAFALVTANQYSQAQKALLSYITKYPKGKYVNEARYWSGEIYFLKKQYSKAEKQFSLVIKNGQDTKRLSVSKLRLARIYLSTNRVKQAKSLLQKIQKQYPGTTESRMAVIYSKEV